MKKELSWMKGKLGYREIDCVVIESKCLTGLSALGETHKKFQPTIDR